MYNNIIDLANLKALFYIFPNYEDYVLFRKKVYKFFDYFFFEYYDEENFKETQEYREFCSIGKIENLLEKVPKYTSIFSFISEFFDIYKKDSIEYFYTYLHEHENERDKIGNLLEKIDKLGIENIALISQEDMLNLQSKTLLSSQMPDRFYFMENMQAVPNYEGRFRYTSYDTNYIIEITKVVGQRSITSKLVWCMGKIIVSSLTFDPKRLPDKIITESVIEEIKSLNDGEYLKKCEILRNSLVLNIATMELRQTYHELIRELHNVSDKGELERILKSVNQNIERLKKYSDQYTESLIGDTITKELLHEEKKDYYLKKRRK